MTLQEAKDQIARDYGYENWFYVDLSKESEEVFRDKVAELYARSKWDEATLAQMILNDKRIADIEEYQLKPLQEKYDALCTYVNERKA